MNELRAEEKGHLQLARKLMHKYGKTVYKHAGVQMALVPGDEKITVKVLRDNGEASSSGSDDAGGEDEAAGSEGADAGGDPADAGRE